MSNVHTHHQGPERAPDSFNNERLGAVAALQSIITGLVTHVCAVNGISHPRVVDRFSTGTHPAFHLNALYNGKERDVVVKLLLAERDGQSFFARESAAYSTIGGSQVRHLTPRLLASGTIQSSESCPGCSYIIVSFAKGVCVNQGFLGFSPAEQSGFARQVGEALRGLHETEVALDQAPALSSCRLRSVLEANSADLVQQGGEFARGSGSWRGLSPHASAGAAEFVRRNSVLLDSLRDSALLHGDPHRDHFFVRRGESGAVELSGIIDFADAVLFDPLYDFTSVHMDLLGGDIDLLSTALEAYGITPDVDVRKKLLLLSLLHEFDIFERIERDRVMRPMGPLGAPLGSITWNDFKASIFGLGVNDE